MLGDAAWGQSVKRPREEAPQRTIPLGATIEPGDVGRIAAELRALERADPLTDIEVLVECTGGSAQAALDLVDVIGSVPCDVATYATGPVADVGLLVLAAGTQGKRHALTSARLTMRKPADARVMREPVPGAAGGFLPDRGVRAALREVALAMAGLTGRRIEQVLADMRAERTLGAEEARAYGLVDEVVERRKPLTRQPPDRFRDADGGTLLHRAYYEGDLDQARRLIALGADPGLRNRFGLTPPLMSELRSAESQLHDLAGLLNPANSWGHIGPAAYPRARTRDRTWTDPDAAARLCALLRGHAQDVYAVALGRAAAIGEPRAILRCAIKVGRLDSLGQLVTLLDRHGTPGIATDYLNCGSWELTEAARQWAHRHRFEILEWTGGGHGRWGTG